MCHLKLFSQRTSLICMLAMTSSFFFAEIIVGYITNSSALIADSFHMLSDVLSLIVGFLAVTFSAKDSNHNTYGWVRAETLGALANSVFLLALCFSIIVEAIPRLIFVETIENPVLVLGVGSAGLLINLIGLVLFHGHSHGHHHHDHDNDHHHHNHNNKHHHHHKHDHKDKSAEVDNKKKQHTGEQLNMKGVFLHVLGDALGSVVVIISALTIYLAEGNWRFYFDPVMSLVIAGIIIWTTAPLLKRSAQILLQDAPSHIKQSDLLFKIKEVKEVVSVHELHVWQLSGNCAIASAHVIMHNEDDFIEIAKKLNKIFHDMGVHSLTLQPEIYNCYEGVSNCGNVNCCYLLKDEQNVFYTIDDFMTNSSSHRDNRNDTSSRRPSGLRITNTCDSCMLSCVSDHCDEYRCCAGKQKRESVTTIFSTDINDTCENATLV